MNLPPEASCQGATIVYEASQRKYVYPKNVFVSSFKLFLKKFVFSSHHRSPMEMKVLQNTISLQYVSAK